jgi:hypothetical protein
VAFIGSMKRSVKDFLLLFSNFNNYMIWFVCLGSSHVT